MKEGLPKYIKKSTFLPETNHSNSDLLNRKDRWFEYNRKLRETLLQAFDESGLQTSTHFQYCLTPEQIFMDTSIYFANILSSNHPATRTVLDQALNEKYFGLANFNRDCMPPILPEAINKEITQNYLQKVDITKLQKSLTQKDDPVLKNIAQIILQIINPDQYPQSQNETTIHKGKIKNGRCSDVEGHFLAYLSGCHRNRHHGYINLILDNKNDPLMIEKITTVSNPDEGLGISHNCISLKPTRQNGILIPSGAIFTADPKDQNTNKETEEKGAINYTTHLQDYNGFQFRRMSILSVPQDIRELACGSYFTNQKDFDYATGHTNYDLVTPEHIADFARVQFNLK